MSDDRLSQVFAALADPTRRDIVARLTAGDATVNELAEPYNVTVQAISKHLRVLEDAGVVSRTRDAQRRPCHLEAEVFDLMTKWIERYRRAAEERFQRLDALLDRMADDSDSKRRQQPRVSRRDRIMNTTTKHETEINADPGLPTIEIVREFDAPRERVFRAFTDPDLYAQWIGPRSLDNRIDTWDCRTGGSWRYVSSRGDEEYSFYGSFHEVRPDDRIVQTFTYEGAPDGVALETVTFEDLDGGRSRVTMLSVVESMETRDAVIASGMESGVIEGFEKLDELLAGSA